MSNRNSDIDAAFASVHGRRPSFQEMLLVKEAMASVKLDKDPAGGTQVVGEEGGYSVQGGDWKDDEIFRLKGLLRLALDSAEKSWAEGWDTRDKLVGKVKHPDPDTYNPYKVTDDEVADDE